MFIFCRFEIVGWLNIKLTVLISTEDKRQLRVIEFVLEDTDKF